MDTNSLREVIENKIKTLDGDNFQDFCDRLFSELYPDYTPVRAGGKKGDLKNDGYCTKERLFLQAHATIRVEASKIKDKIKTDLEGCIAKQNDVKKWVFATNQTLNGDIQKFIDDLRKEHTDIEIESWGHMKLCELVLSIENREKISKIIGINIPENLYQEQVVSETKEVEIINKIFIDVLAKIDTEFEEDEDSSSISLEEKIQLNFQNEVDREEVRDYFKYALQKISLIDQRMGEEDIENQRDLQSFVLSRYKKLQRQNLEPIVILNKLFEEIIPLTEKPYENLAKAFILFFFEDCTIFEKNKEKIYVDTK